MKLWTSLNTLDENSRWQTLSAHLTAAGAANQFSPWEGPADVPPDLNELNKFYHLRVDPELSPAFLQRVKVQSSWVDVLGVIDGLVKTPQGWSPLCALFESFHSLVFEQGSGVDTRGNVLVAGAGSVARVAIAAFFKSGFQHFLLSDLDADRARQTIREVEAKFFGLKLEWVPTEKIVLLPGESSVLVNCVMPSSEVNIDGNAENNLLTELSYMNFLRRPGFLFDLARGKQPSTLVQEAKDAEVKILNGNTIAARTDIIWAKWAFGVDLDFTKYLAALEGTPDQTPAP